MIMYSYTQQKKKVNTFSSLNFSYKTLIKINKLYIKLREILLSLNLVGENKVKIYAWVNTFIYLFQGAKVKLAKLHKT